MLPLILRKANKMFFGITFKSLLIAAAVFAGCVLSAGVQEDMKEFSQRLDFIERSFWRAVLMPREQRNNPQYAASLQQLITLARKLRTNCIGTDTKACKKTPDIHAKALAIQRCYDNFIYRSKNKARRLSVGGTGLRDYQRRHNKLMREKAKEEEESSDGKAGKKRAKFTGLPVLSQIDEMDYADFLNEVSDKNKQKFYSWLDSIKSREQSISAMKIFETWQESVCDLRIALVQMAKYGKFKEEIKK